MYKNFKTQVKIVSCLYFYKKVHLQLWTKAVEGHISELDKTLGEEGSLGIEEDSLGIEEGRPAVLDNLLEVVGDDLCSKAKTKMIFLTMSFMN